MNTRVKPVRFTIAYPLSLPVLHVLSFNINKKTDKQKLGPNIGLASYSYCYSTMAQRLVDFGKVLRVKRARGG